MHPTGSPGGGEATARRRVGAEHRRLVDQRLTGDEPGGQRHDRYDATHGRHRRSAVSSQIVNGPSFTSSTAIDAPNSPSCVGTPSASSDDATRSHSSRARSGRRRVGEPGPSTAPRVRVERELRHEQHRRRRRRPATGSSGPRRPRRCAARRSGAPAGRPSRRRRRGPRRAGRAVRGRWTRRRGPPTRTSARVTRCRSARTGRGYEASVAARAASAIDRIRATSAAMSGAR